MKNSIYSVISLIIATLCTHNTINCGPRSKEPDKSDKRPFFKQYSTSSNKKSNSNKKKKSKNQKSPPAAANQKNKP